jgi:AAA+ superfamily predicted ATPase
MDPIEYLRKDVIRGRSNKSFANWRDAALDESLRCSSEDVDPEDGLLRAIRRFLPERVTAIFYANRYQLLRFLEKECTRFRSLLSGSDYYCSCDMDREFRPYLGWFAARWRGKEIEIALPPTTMTNGCAICIAPNQNTLRRLMDCLTDYVIRPRGRSLIYSEGWENAPEIDAELGKVTWEDIVLPPDLMLRIREAIEGFFHHREAFAALNFPWRRGVLLVGPPGTGKTMVCKAVAAALPDMPFLYVRDLSDYNQEEAISSIFARARMLAPCILAFEDMDGLVNEANRSVFLNELDGFKNNEGLLIIASSNHPERIDEALLKRPSRFDRVFHLGLPLLAEREEYCRRILQRSSLTERFAPTLDGDKLVREVSARTEGFTPAYLKEAFISAALHLAQSGIMELDHRFEQAVLDQVDELRQYLRQVRDPGSLGEMRSHDGPIGLRR